MNLSLSAMTAAEFAAMLQATIPEYAAEKVASGAWAEADALHLARETTAKLLPQGQATTGHYFYHLRLAPDARPVGHLWFAREGTHAYLYDISLHEEFRGQGLGRQAMTLLEEAVRALGLQTIKLHVFGHNRRARALYESLGYTTTDLSMSKALQRP